jgi:adenylate cyclase
VTLNPFSRGDAAYAPARGRPRLPPLTVRGVRLASGLVLFAFVTSHLTNHALGLISMPVLAEGRELFLAVWRNAAGEALLYGAITIHVLLAFYALYRRRSLRMSIGEATQIVLGFAAPPLLLIHALGTGYAAQAFDYKDSYEAVLLTLWADDPATRLKQIAATLIVWAHGCFGLFYWLRLKPWFARAMPVLYGAALLLPVVSILGYVSAGRAVARYAADQTWRNSLLAVANAPTADEFATVYALEAQILAGLGLLFLATLAARAVRTIVEQRRGVVRIAYPDNRQVTISTGATILDASQRYRISHAAVCGGRGRCSTCRVRINRGLDALPPASEAEARVLRRVGAAPDVRLACQTRPTGNISVTPLLPPDASPRDSFARTASMQGQEQQIAVLFADIRGFTTISEDKLPYDVVFMLNRYFRSMGEAIDTAGGRVDKFIGDGIMALFGVDQSPQSGSERALRAAREMALRLDSLNELLAHDLPEPLRIGIGIHCGPAIVGEMGYGNVISFTAVGDTVNTASRLETMTKNWSAQLVVSEDVAALAGIDLSAFPTEQTEVRGRQGTMTVRIVADARDLPDPAVAAAPVPVPLSNRETAI